MFPHLMAHLSVAPTGPVGPAPAPTGSEPTRRTPPVGSASTCANAASSPSSPNHPTRSATANDAAPEADARPSSMPSTTGAATSSNADSATSNNGVASPPALRGPGDSHQPEAGAGSIEGRVGGCRDPRVKQGAEPAASPGRQIRPPPRHRAGGDGGFLRFAIPGPRAGDSRPGFPTGRPPAVREGERRPVRPGGPLPGRVARPGDRCRLARCVGQDDVGRAGAFTGRAAPSSRLLRRPDGRLSGSQHHRSRSHREPQRREGRTMSKELKHIGPGETADPIKDIAAAITAAAGINGHKPEDAEIRELLEEQGEASSEQNIAAVRAAVEG